MEKVTKNHMGKGGKCSHKSDVTPPNIFIVYFSKCQFFFFHWSFDRDLMISMKVTIKLHWKWCTCAQKGGCVSKIASLNVLRDLVKYFLLCHKASTCISVSPCVKWLITVNFTFSAFYSMFWFFK